MVTNTASVTPLDESAIRLELSNILASKRFRQANRLSSLLHYVVEESLAGRRDRIKAFTIAQAVFGRDETFDPQRDPLVRVEASRLRKCLAEYYAELDEQPSVRIDVPRGGYAPLFTPRIPEPSKRRHWPRNALALLVICIPLLAIVWWHSDSGQETAPADIAPVQNPSAFLAVLPLSNAPDDMAAQGLAGSFVDSTITMLAKIPGLSVMAHSSVIAFDDVPISIQRLRSEYGITHVLRGRIESAETALRIQAQLIDTLTLETIWSDSLKGTRQRVWAMQDELTENLSTALSIQLEPGEKARLRGRHTESIEALSLYRQGLILIFPPNEIDRVRAARQVFRRVREIDPKFAGGYAGEAWSHAVTALFGLSPTPENELQQATRLAENAIRIDPAFGTGHAVLGFTQALSGQHAGAIAQVRLASAVQPGDAFVQFVQGITLILVGMPEQAFAPLDEASRLNPFEPRSPYLNVQAVGRFANADYELALEYMDKNRVKGGPEGPHIDVFRAASLAHLGRDKEAQSVIDTLVDKFPDYSYAPWMEKWLKSEEHLESTMEKLNSLGLNASD